MTESYTRPGEIFVDTSAFIALRDSMFFLVQYIPYVRIGHEIAGKRHDVIGDICVTPLHRECGHIPRLSHFGDKLIVIDAKWPF